MMMKGSLPVIHHSSFIIPSCRDVAAHVAEAVAELFGGHVARAGELFDPGRVREVTRLKPNHVLARDAVALAVGVDHADARAPRAGLADVCEGDGHHAAALDARAG